LDEGGSETVEIDASLAAWQQGDLILAADFPFLRLIDLARPLTATAIKLSKSEGSEGLSTVAEEGTGAMIVSQTCDLVRACAQRPYAQVCALVEVDSDVLQDVRRGKSVRFIWVEGLDGTNLVGDLEQVMTVEKAVLARYADRRRPGARSDSEVRALARAIANKYDRAAFPDDFVFGLERMRQEIVKKHSKGSSLGRFLRDVLEIRVRPTPAWEAGAEIQFLFVFERSTHIPDDADDHVTSLLGRFVRGAYGEISGRAVGLDQLTALTYRKTDRLDLDHLSKARGHSEKPS
jgi:hypothetical protein